MRDRLAEADAGVEADPLLGDAARDRERHPLFQERGDLLRDIVVARLLLHRPRLALHVHEAEIGARVRYDPGELRVAAKRRDVVDENRAALERRARDPGLRGVDRERQLGADTIEDRHDAAQLLLRRDACGAGPRRLAAEVDQRRSLLDYLRQKDETRYTDLIAKLGLRK